jgi:hypothetical protein
MRKKKIPNFMGEHNELNCPMGLVSSYYLKQLILRYITIHPFFVILLFQVYDKKKLLLNNITTSNK